MLIIFTGNGKGKTTAAMGQALRAVGNGSKVLMVQFIKGPWKSGEHEAVLALGENFKIERRGKGFVGIGGDKLPFEEHVKAAQEALEYSASEVSKKKWNILILDEVWNAIELKLISEDDLSDFISSHLPKLDHLIMTGRNCPQKFLDEADLVTEMREIKHPFQYHVPAQKAIEY
jgi:cob(I)alamin adenosyltransferase